MWVAHVLRRLQRFDPFILLAVLFLFAFGLAAIYSVDLSREGAEFLVLRKHSFIFLLGVVIMFLVSFVNHLELRNFGRLFYIGAVLLLVLVLFFGTTIRGTTGWFIIFGLSFQPIELMKLALAVELARYFSEHARRKFGWREILGSGLLTAIPVILAMRQPDFGSAALLIGMWAVVLLFAGIRSSHVAILTGGGSALGIFAWFFLFKEYQKDRILTFLYPSADPLSTGYNVTQAKIAIGSGQWFGRGLGFGSQSQLRFLPESQTDFVFAVIAEELGFFGVCLVFLAAGVLFWRILVLAYQSSDHFTQFLCAGIFGSLFIQFLVNVSVNLAILPATGVALPFMSAGGSSLLISFIMVGILQSVAAQIRPEDKWQKSWYTVARDL
ncbi:MAG: FtsW/RodA/SpoVE family cell cycle protein [Patescibacteria group bacterium]|jgi:rod shape determining protein RodA